MAFDWNDLGRPVNHDEVEITLIGPGFGECLVLHVGGGRWITVDSCVDSQDQVDRRPVAERYLRGVGVDLESQVDLVIATHWHADHVRGLGRLVDVCRNATFSCAQSLVKEEFQVFVEEMSTASAATDGAKLRDFREAIRHLHSRQQVIRFSTAGKTLKSWGAGAIGHAEGCQVRALSPSDKEYQLFLLEIAQAAPKVRNSKRSATARTPNLASVVLHVQFETFALLLGADMETHHDPLRGWTAAILEGTGLQVRPASLIKIPHHGSATGHHDQMWSQLLEPRPIGLVTPFNSLPDGKKLPTAADISRLTSHTSRLLSSSQRPTTSTRGRDPAVERSLRESQIQIRDLATPFGMVRCRRQPGATWNLEVFQPAAELT